MRRLSIIDVDGGAQPLANEDGSVWTVFNGEIYNFPTLRDELKQKGHTLRSRGDTETIVHLYEEYGVSFAKRLNGMFGIAIWDQLKKRLVLTRDHSGIKPMYYAETKDGLAFASEIKSLIAGHQIAPTLDPEAAELFLAFGYVPGPTTLFRGVRKLPPASTLVFEEGKIASLERYWSPYDRGTASSERDSPAQFLDLLRKSVRAQMVSDVPIGVMLSGGLDSSLVTALMVEQSSTRVKTFSVGFAESARANELDDAKRVATALGTDHHGVLTSAADHPDLLEDVLWHLEEPVADLSSLGFFLLCKLASREVKVALSGQGADELTGGYTKHVFARASGALSFAPRRIRNGLGSALLDYGEGSSALRGVAALLSQDPVLQQFATSRMLGSKARLQLLTPEFRNGTGETHFREAILSRLDPAATSPLAKSLAIDSQMALVDLMFLYFDKVSMAASLEVRVPFMDPEIVTFCARLPDEWKISKGETKRIVRVAAKGLVDSSIINKPKQGFFAGALGTWISVQRTGLISDVLTDSRSIGRGIFLPSQLQRLARAGSDNSRAAQRQLLSSLLLEMWHRVFVDSDGRAAHLAAD